ncbi:hypothetical protein GPECTOR_34g737 [Gonium pectorale]|uniref:Coenzyme Q-binding protein COQ10 START domain-containing protein n=1 Tax=Gonium pectorale TaxID=33097 RepID=A0A150GCM8_GONPE|nr:hypothetical protein GPECTOR_34g737 [Gonium pectorale]|eukprot:KXZ47578.1 hypothetical protein GPECTOR_34g737 [Gonium pectorale]
MALLDLNPTEEAGRDPQSPVEFGVPEVAHISLDQGKHTVRGRIRLRAPASAVYSLLSDYGGCQRVFSNIASSEVHRLEGGGVEVVQGCRWSFLAFSGTFLVHLAVAEDSAAGSLLFRLIRSNFMRDFEGRWTVTPPPGRRAGAAGNAEEEEGEWCEVEHVLSVVPSMPMPPPVAYYTRSIFVRQVEGILTDLRRGVEAELAARG